MLIGLEQAGNEPLAGTCSVDIGFAYYTNSGPPVVSDASTMIQLRQCLGRFATGVTVVTCSDAAGKPYGITANSFSSVSLEPPLVLWNIAKISNSLQAYLDAKHFAIHVLTAEQEFLARHFAQTDHSRYDNIDYEFSKTGVPLLPDVLARFDCRTETVAESGDHHIIIGEVVNFLFDDGEPLLFYRGDYRRVEHSG